MMNREEITSPDGSLHLVILRDGEEITIGFRGFPWHTHGTVLVADLALVGVMVGSAEEAASMFVADVLAGRVPIALMSQGGQVEDVVATYHASGLPSGDDVVLRQWSGRPWLNSREHS